MSVEEPRASRTDPCQSFPARATEGLKPRPGTRAIAFEGRKKIRSGPPLTGRLRNEAVASAGSTARPIDRPDGRAAIRNLDLNRDPRRTPAGIDGHQAGTTSSIHSPPYKPPVARSFSFVGERVGWPRCARVDRPSCRSIEPRWPRPHSHTVTNKKPRWRGAFSLWRRGWDSNPRYARGVHLISSQARSTTPAPLLMWSLRRRAGRASLRESAPLSNAVAPLRTTADYNWRMLPVRLAITCR